MSTIDATFIGHAISQLFSDFEKLCIFSAQQSISEAFWCNLLAHSLEKRKPKNFRINRERYLPKDKMHIDISIFNAVDKEIALIEIKILGKPKSANLASKMAEDIRKLSRSSPNASKFAIGLAFYPDTIEAFPTRKPLTYLEKNLKEFIDAEIELLSPKLSQVIGDEAKHVPLFCNKSIATLQKNRFQKKIVIAHGRIGRSKHGGQAICINFFALIAEVKKSQKLQMAEVLTDETNKTSINRSVNS